MVGVSSNNFFMLAKLPSAHAIVQGVGVDMVLDYSTGNVHLFVEVPSFRSSNEVSPLSLYSNLPNHNIA
jgi:hypothetical protein